MPNKQLVTFYFDPISPYAWLASKQIERIEAAGCRVVFQPVLFAAMLDAHGQKGPAEIPAKRAYTFRDVMRQAAQLGLRFAGPPGHPFNPLAALRMALAVSAPDARRRVALALCAACWERGDDISSPAVLLAVAEHCGLDGPALALAAQQPALKQQLADDTARAIADGIFGVPTFRMGSELFWGGDRVDALLWHAAGHRIDEAALADFLARAPLAQRKSA